MKIKNLVIGISSFLFIMVGVDKFFTFLEPPCSLMGHIPPGAWKLLGVLLIASGILIWFPKFRKHIAGFFAVFMLVFTIIHLIEETYDIGGSLFMAAILGLLVWDPKFLNNKDKNVQKP